MTARTLARAGAIVVAAYLGSRVLGWLRLVVIGNLFGAQADLDAYFAAFRIPDLIYQLVAAGAVSSSLIPVLAGLLHQDERARAFRVVSTVLNAMLIVLIGFSLVMAIFAPVLVPLLVPGFDVPSTELTVRLTRIMLVSPILLAAGAVASSVLNAEGRFGAAAAAPLLYNLAIIGAALVLSPALGIDSLAVGVVLGSALHVAIQVPAVRRRMNYDLVLDLKDAAARQVLRLMVPRSIGLGANQITFIVNTTLASTVAAGAVSVYTIAFTIFLIPIGVIGMPLGVLLLPSLSRAVAAGDVRGFGSLLVGAIRMLVVVMFFFTAVGIVVSRQVVELLFGYGAFDTPALDLTAETLVVFLAGLAASSLCVVLARAFYSGQDTTTPVVGVVISVIVNVIVSVATVGQLGLVGLALGVALGDWVEAVFLAVLLRRRVPSLGMGSFMGIIPLVAAGAALAGIVAYGVLRTSEALLATYGKPGILVQVLLATAAGAAVYLLYTRLVRLPELPRAIALLRDSIGKRGSPG